MEVMEVEKKHQIWRLNTSCRDPIFPLPWLWEEEYYKYISKINSSEIIIDIVHEENHSLQTT